MGSDVSDGDRGLRLSVREKVLIYLTGGITPFLQKVGKFISHVLEQKAILASMPMGFSRRPLHGLAMEQ